MFYSIYSGGYAAVIFQEDEMIEELSGGEAMTTSNRMEITAAMVGLRAARQPSVITLYSDSQYVLKTLTQGWKRMENLDLWALLDAAAMPHRIIWRWLRGHHGNPGNDRADQLAKQAARLHRAHV